MTKLCDINLGAREKLPPAFAEKSGIGSHFVDAFVKPMNTKLPDGTAVKCKRRGLKIMLSVGAKKGDGLMRRLQTVLLHRVAVKKRRLAALILNRLHARLPAFLSRRVGHEIARRRRGFTLLELMFAIGIAPPMPVSDSIAALTAPHEVTVVIAANRLEPGRPKRVSLPSMLPPDCRSLAA